MKIVVSGAARQMNLGGPSIFHGLVQVLRRVFPGCEIAYHEAGAGFSGAALADPDYPDIRVWRGHPDAKKTLLAAWRARWRSGREPGRTLEQILVEEIRSADLFVDAWGIDFTARLSQMNFKGALLGKPFTGPIQVHPPPPERPKAGGTTTFAYYEGDSTTPVQDSGNVTGIDTDIASNNPIASNNDVATDNDLVDAF